MLNTAADIYNLVQD